MNKKTQDFIAYVKAECKKNGVKCDLRKVSYVRLSKGMKCSGWFDSDSEQPRLVCSMNRSDFLEILVHEFCHVQQWIEQCPEWIKSDYSMNYIDEWLSGKEVKNIKKHIGLSRDLELDNEKRSVKMIKKFNLDIDIEMYIKRANSYVLFYNWMLESRKWSTPQNSPYKNKKLLSVMPSTFRMDYTKIPEKIRKIYEEENI